MILHKRWALAQSSSTPSANSFSWISTKFSGILPRFEKRSGKLKRSNSCGIWKLPSSSLKNGETVSTQDIITGARVITAWNNHKTDKIYETAFKISSNGKQWSLTIGKWRGWALLFPVYNLEKISRRTQNSQIEAMNLRV